MKNFFSLIILILLSISLSAQVDVTVEVQNSSWIAIHGSTNVLPFKLVHNGDKLPIKTIKTVATESQDRLYLSQNELSIAVKNFTSDNSMALRDFMKLLKASVYPTIDIRLNYFESQPGNHNKDTYSQGNAVVNIVITGVTRQYKIPVLSNRQGDYISVKGGKKISIRDFGLKPPVEMMGLIKVSEWINIDFNIFCKLDFRNELSDISRKKAQETP